jgi:nitrate reductase delta subunit
MILSPDARAVLASYAALFAYPTADLEVPVRRASALAGPGAGAALDRFRGWLSASTIAEREEEHTAVFDLDPACPPYVGHHLVGEGPRRGAFLARLAGVYAAAGFAGEGELPDHLSLVLRFLAASPDGPDRDALLVEALVPALERMRAALARRETPYRHLLESLGAFARAVAAAADHAGREVPA